MGEDAIRPACPARTKTLSESSRPALPLPDRPAIAVLPFVNMSGDPEQEYFSDGISEDIITALSKLRWFFVIARNSSFIYKGKAVHMKQVAEELGVRYVVEGSVRKGGDRVRITAQLNDVATGSHIWAERYDRDLADVFAVQDEITESIVAAIEPQLYAAENFRAQRKPPDSMDAWDLVMRALSHYWRVTRQDNVVAQALLEKAIAIDPNYGQALGVLAASYMFSAHMGWADMARRCRSPSARRWRRSAPTARTPGRTTRSGNVYLFARRFDDSLAEFETGAAAQSEFFAGAGLLRPVVVLLRALAGRRRGGPSRAAAEPARSVSRRSITASPPTAQFLGDNYEEAMRLSREASVSAAISSAATGCSPPPPAWPGAATSRRRAAGASPRAAQHFAGLDRAPDADPARRRPRALSGRLPACRLAVTGKPGPSQSDRAPSPYTTLMTGLI